MIGGVTDVATSPATSIPDTGSADPTSPSNTTNLSVTASTSDINARSPLNTYNPSNHIAPDDSTIHPIVAADHTLLHTRIVITCRDAEFRQKPSAFRHTDMLLRENPPRRSRIAHRQPHIESAARHGLHPETLQQRSHRLAPERIRVACACNGRIRLTIRKHLAQQLLQEPTHPAGSQPSPLHNRINRFTRPRQRRKPQIGAMRLRKTADMNHPVRQQGP